MIFMVILLLLLACVVIALQLIITSDLPRSLTERSLKKKLGMDVTIERLQTDWDGTSLLSGVRFQVHDEPPLFLDVAAIRVRHHKLPVLLLAGLGISTVEAAGTTFRMAGEAAGESQFTIGDAAIQVTMDYPSDNPDESRWTVLIDDAYLGRLEAAVFQNEERVCITGIDGRLFAGTLSGQVELRPEAWEQLSVYLAWKDLDLRKLSRWWQRAETVLGSTSGTLELKPSEQPQPLEPLALAVQVDFEGGVPGRFVSDRLQLRGAVGRGRLLLTDLEIPVFGGTIGGRVRLSKNEERYHLYTRCRLANIDLSRAVDALSEAEQAIVGVLNGSGFMTTALDLEGMSGSIDVKLTDSNLAGNAIIGTLYRTLNLNFQDDALSGYGRAELRFAGTKLKIGDFYYYNQGVEIRGAGTIRNFRQGRSSPVEGIAVASSRPLKDIALPGFETLDRFLFFAQKDAAYVEIGGTAGTPEVQVVTLPQMREFLNKFLGEAD